MLMGEDLLVFCGERGVGRSTMALRLRTGHFLDDYDPTGEIDLRVGPVNCVIVDRWQTGRYTYGSAEDNIRKGKGLFLLYSIACRIHGLIETILRVTDEDKILMPTILIGTKCDLDDSCRQVTTKEGEDLAASLGILFFETSSKDNINVTEAFDELVRMMMAPPAPAEPEKKKKSGCLVA